MSFESIVKAIEKHIHLNGEEIAIFTSLLQFKVVRKKQHILNAGEICQWNIFVIKGCLRGYTIDKNGLEHALSFAPQGWWIGDLYSLISQKPGNLNIDALDDTEVFLLFKKDQDSLYQQLPQFERFFRILAENSLVSHQQRIIDNLSLTAEEKYLKFCKTYPTLQNVLSQKQVASYIGVTPEFFSRMRTGLLKK